MRLSYNVIKKECVNSNSIYTVKAPEVIKKNEQVSEEAVDDNSVEETRILCESLLKEAERKKEQMLKEARAEAEKIKKDAYDMAYKKGYSEGMKKGTEEGYKETSKIRQSAKDVLQEAHRITREYIDMQRQEIAKLSFCIAEKIIRYQVDANDTVIFNIVKNSIDEAVAKKQVVIRVNPLDYALVECRMEELSEKTGDNIIISLIKDGEIARGGCKIETEVTSVDATIDSQLQTIKEMLVG